jgi:magnesium chelatase subunit I
LFSRFERCSPSSRNSIALATEAADYVALVGEMKALREPVLALTGGDESAASVASAIEFLLEGLHLSKRLNKEAVGGRAQYRGRG